MSKIVIFTALPDDLVRFSLPILQTLIAAGYTVVAAAATEYPLAGVLQLDIVTEMAKIGVRYKIFPLSRVAKSIHGTICRH